MSHVIASRLARREIPEISVTRFVLRHADRLADRPALIDGVDGRRLTYRQLSDDIRRIAGGLTARGFGKGHVLAILAPNVPEFATVFHGTALTGGTVTTINPLYTPREIAHQLKDAGARFLFTVPAALPAVLEAQAQTDIEEVFVLGEVGDTPATPLDTLYGEALGDDALPEIDPRDDVVVLPYSSGTTGLPKGVMLTHYNLVANLVQLDQIELKAGQNFVAALPLFHIYGMQVILNCVLANGGTVITMPRFDLRGFLGSTNATASRGPSWCRRSCWRWRATLASPSTISLRWKRSSARPLPWVSIWRRRPRPGWVAPWSRATA